MSERVHSFAPLLGQAPRVLILGSMPGRCSLDADRYYAHPRNAFWPIMGALLGFEPALEYPARCRALTAGGIALWDVMASCERRGSLDADIVAASIVANDIAGLLAAEPGIRVILFNGGKAEESFRRHVQPTLPAGLASVPCHRLPSTSPAHAGLSLAAKHALWREALAPYLPAIG
ncbi:MAG: DNA-deoxyinosine glycosylase [Rhodocyclaceae bacterium]|nr:DNA-deoxyinosine glycosylase [Rhodocyclaceae bacterium]